MADQIALYEKLKQEQDRIAKELEALQASEAFQQDMMCKEAIQKVLKEHVKTAQDLLRLFPDIMPATTKAKPRIRKASGTRRPLIRYTHPDTGKVVESRGLNQKTLQEWIKEHDIETVKDWGQVIEPGAADE